MRGSSTDKPLVNGCDRNLKNMEFSGWPVPSELAWANNPTTFLRKSLLRRHRLASVLVVLGAHGALSISSYLAIEVAPQAGICPGGIDSNRADNPEAVLYD